MHYAGGMPFPSLGKTWFPHGGHGEHVDIAHFCSGQHTLQHAAYHSMHSVPSFRTMPGAFAQWTCPCGTCLNAHRVLLCTPSRCATPTPHLIPSCMYGARLNVVENNWRSDCARAGRRTRLSTAAFRLKPDVTLPRYGLDANVMDEPRGTASPIQHTTPRPHPTGGVV